MRVKPNDLVGNGPGGKYLENTARVLVLSDSSKQCWLIYLPALKKESGKEQQIQDYVKAPFKMVTDEFYELLASGTIVVLKTRSAVALSDADRLAEARACGKEESVIRDIRKRDKRFAAIQSLVCEEGSNVLRNIEDLLSDPALPHKIAEVAQRHAFSEKTTTSMSALAKYARCCLPLTSGRHLISSSGGVKNSTAQRPLRCCLAS